MNPLTLVKRIQNINKREATLGISEEASWHAKYKDSAYVYIGGIPFDLTEGDLLAVFAQYGEIVDVNLVRDKGTGKSKGFAFLAYEDQRSTNLAVDNLNGAQILGRTIRVDHVTKYKKKEEEDEEAERQKREERGVCRAFQRGQCNRGDGCKFSHDEQRARNTGWGAEEDRRARWAHDEFDAEREGRKYVQSSRAGESSDRGEHRYDDRDAQISRRKENDAGNGKPESDSKYRDRRDGDKFKRREETTHRDNHGISDIDRRLEKHDAERKVREDHDRRDEKRSRRHDSHKDHGRDRERERKSVRESSPHRHRTVEDDRYRSRR